jgi:hypothetical protein
MGARQGLDTRSSVPNRRQRFVVMRTVLRLAGLVDRRRLEEVFNAMKAFLIPSGAMDSNGTQFSSRGLKPKLSAALVALVSSSQELFASHSAG